uniref:(northern house mosquito) hypothetical protein n=1 Tax=Culex pipiens TaxID=7175 RepID=A0A8D8CYM6_CULPI
MSPSWLLCCSSMFTAAGISSVASSVVNPFWCFCFTCTAFIAYPVAHSTTYKSQSYTQQSNNAAAGPVPAALLTIILRGQPPLASHSSISTDFINSPQPVKLYNV